MGEELLYENYTLLLNSVMLRKLDNNKKAIMNFKNSIITQVNDILTVAPFQSRKNIFSILDFQNNYNTLLNFHLKEKKVDLNLIGSKLLITDFINILYDKFNFPYYHIIRDKLIITNNPSPSLVRINKLNHNFNNVELERYISNLLLAQLQNKDDIAHKIQHIYINSVDKKIFNLVNITGYFSKFEEKIHSVNFIFVNKDSYEENNTYIEKLKNNNYIFASGTEDFISSISKKDKIIRLRDINFIHIESLITTIYIDKNYESFQNEKYNLEKAIPPGLILFLPAVWFYINFIIGSNKTLRREYESNIEEFISKAAYATLDINSHIISNIYEQALRRAEGKYNSTYGNPKDQERFIKKVNLIENVDLSYKSINSIMAIVSGDDKFGL
ncbi:MAG: hypothetical protein E7215_09510 [Clostridium sulfidigenes]|uniref:Uncharacterized protein n=1 Tax=Clostridium sulfidigenes TaxID=318464 RepID=A0A927W8T1_9CLOT|nr:hypothetical protein [Clostridium sulfidigenes]